MPGLSWSGPGDVSDPQLPLQPQRRSRRHGRLRRTLAIGAMIARSAPHTAWTSGALDLGDAEFPVVEPDALADLVWDLDTMRDRVEVCTPITSGRR